MPRFNSRNMSLRPIHRIKHVIDKQSGVTLNTANVTNLIFTVDAPVLGSVDQVETGSKVNGIYLKVECYATSSAALSNVYMAVFKNVAGSITRPAINAVGSADTKRYIIHQEMVMLQQVTNGNPRTLFNGVVAIPRGYRRFGPDDRLEVIVLAPGVNINLCIQCHYKEFR